MSFAASSSFQRSSSFADAPSSMRDSSAMHDIGPRLPAPRYWEWWRASVLVDTTTDFDWTGMVRSLLLRQAVVAKKPTWTASSPNFNGRSVVETNGDNILPSTATIDATGTQRITMWSAQARTAAMSSTNAGMGPGVPGFGVGQGFEFLWTAARTEFARLQGDVGTSQNDTFAGTDMNAHSYVQVNDKSLATNEASIYKDGVRGSAQTVDANNTDNFGNQTFQLFARGDQSLYSRCAFADVALYLIGDAYGRPSPLSDPERAALDRLGAARYFP